jgi:L-serine dehydratase
MLKYDSIEELVKAATQKNKKISEIVLADEAKQMEKNAAELYAKMAENFKVMCASVVTGMDP